MPHPWWQRAEAWAARHGITDLRDFCQGIGWVIGLPALSYYLLAHTLSVHGRTHEMLFVALTVAGAVVYAIRRS